MVFEKQMSGLWATTSSQAVPMQVLCLGLSRTGTVSLRQALFDLGYSDVYHMATELQSVFSVVANPQSGPAHSTLWRDLARRKYTPQDSGSAQLTLKAKDFEPLLSTCAAVTDSPCNMFWQELLALYPDARVILTVRDSPEQWYASTRQTIYAHCYEYLIPGITWAGCFRYYASQLFAPQPMAHYLEFTRLQYRHHFGTEFQASEKVGCEMYERHNGAVLEAIKGEGKGREVLVFNIKQGWGPLCEFLGKEAPKDGEGKEDKVFPKSNSREDFPPMGAGLARAVDLMIAMGFAKMVIPVVAVGGITAAAMWWMGRVWARPQTPS